MTFKEFGLDESLLEGIDATGYENATPVQEQVIPLGPGVDEPLAWKPKLAVAPGARSVAQLGAVMVQLVPLVVTVELQALVSVTPEGTVHLTVQLCQLLVPVLVTVTLELKPPGHELAML